MKDSIKVILADDEAPARSLIKEYMQSYPALSLIGECKNGLEAIDQINLLEPDLVFLDIQMPGKTGFEVLLAIKYIPQIIFTTAFEQYAVDAFEANAVDYLLKPFNKARFDKAVLKLLQHDPSSMKNIVALSEAPIILKEYSWPRVISGSLSRWMIFFLLRPWVIIAEYTPHKKVFCVQKVYLNWRPG